MERVKVMKVGDGYLLPIPPTIRVVSDVYDMEVKSDGTIVCKPG